MDAADRNTVLLNFGHIGDVIPGDPDLDGDIDHDDLNAAPAGFGSACPSSN